MFKIHKRRSGNSKTKNRVAWCDHEVASNEKISGRWGSCNCNNCFKKAMFGKTKGGYRITNGTKYTANRFFKIRVENKELMY